MFVNNRYIFAVFAHVLKKGEFGLPGMKAYSPIQVIRFFFKSMFEILSWL